MCDDHSSRVTRRHFLGFGALGALTLVGVAAAGAHPAPGGARRAAPSRTTVVPAAVTKPKPTPAPIDPDAVAARFKHVPPTAWGVDLPGIVSRHPGRGVALTLDACGGPDGSGFDAALIDGLSQRKVPATLFLNKRWIKANPKLARTLAGNPMFELANHGTAHVPLSVTGQAAYGIVGTASVRGVIDEVWGNHQVLTELTGRPPRFFRAGTAHYDDVAINIVKELGETIAGFSINADYGATADSASTSMRVASAGDGDIILGHMNQPGGPSAAGILAGVDQLHARGVTFTHL